MVTEFPCPLELKRLDLFALWRDVPKVGNQLDPFRFRHRIAAYRQLIHATNRDHLFGEDNRKNPLWGLMFQLHWQFRTGRLGGRTPVDDVIDPDASWGYGNYLLCIVPWLGAEAAGIVPGVAISGPCARTQFRYASGGGGTPLDLPAELGEPIEDWRKFFELVKRSDRGHDQEPIRFALWKAHKTSLDIVAERLVGVDPSPNTRQEQEFLRGWCRMVDYLWAAAWPTDFDFMLANGLEVLPERMLEETDASLRLEDMPRPVRANVRHIVALARLPAYRHELGLKMWRRGMRAGTARAEVMSMLDALFNPTPQNRTARLRLLRYFLVG